jgi:hypothetical protein
MILLIKLLIILLTNQLHFMKYIIALSLILILSMTELSFAADIETVFADVNTKTGSLLDWIMNSLLLFICTIAAIATLVAIGFKKLSYLDGLVLVIIIILIGFAPTIVAALLNR